MYVKLSSTQHQPSLSLPVRLHISASLVGVLAGSVVEGGALDVCSMAELVEGFGVETSVATSAEVVVACDVSPVVAVELSSLELKKPLSKSLS